MLIRKIYLDKRWKRKAKGIIEAYNFEVGVLQDKPHRKVLSKSVGLRSFSGGPVRKVSRKNSKVTIAQVSEYVRKRTRINFYTKPFRSRKNKEIIRFTRQFFKFAFGRSEKKRLENTLQAIVRNPILRGDYGTNFPKTSRIKGSYRMFIDSGELFKNIRARAVKKNV